MEILKISSQNWQIVTRKTLRFLRRGRIVICPTDTVYGLIGDATNKKTVAKIFKIKKRPGDKPIPVFVKDLKMAKKIAQVSRKQERFLKSVWPGKVTVILKPKIKLPKGIGKPKREIGLRIPRHKIINRLQAAFDRPLTGTSANISGEKPSIRIKEVISQFNGRKFQPDLVIDSGDLAENKPSMIIDLTVEPPKTLRQ